MGGNANDSNNVWLYSPRFPLSIVAVILYLIPAVVILLQLIRYRSWYLICVFIGALFEIGGYSARAVSTKQQDNVGAYAASLTIIIIAPILVAAGDYLLISRLIRARLPPSEQHVFRISGTKLTRIFVACDVLTFLIQGSGSGIASSNNWEGNSLSVGQDVLIGGLALQLATFGFFIIIMWRFQVKVRTLPDGRPFEQKFPPELRAVYISSAMIIIRCIYRLIEFATGIHAYLFEHEWPYYILEALPMLIAFAAFVLYWPPRYLSDFVYREKEASNKPASDV